MQPLLAPLACLSTALPVQDEAPPPVPPIAIEGVTVVQVADGSSHRDRTVVLAGGLVHAVGARGEVEVPEGARRVDGAGRYLVPGYAEMHGHLPRPDQGRALAEEILFLYLANGITTVRGMQGDPQQLELRAEIEAGTLLGPRLVVGSPALSGRNAPDPATARARVADYADAGFDHVKVHEGLSPETYAAIVEAARAAGLTWSGHVSDAVGLAAALEAGQATVDHLDNVLIAAMSPDAAARVNGLLDVASHVEHVDAARFATIADEFRRADVAVVPTMVLWETFFSDVDPEHLRSARPELRYVPRSLVEQWVGAVRNLRHSIDAEAGLEVCRLRRLALEQLLAKKVDVLMGTDSPQLFSVPGFSLRREVDVLLDCGMSPAEILASGTVSVARHLGEEDSFGEVAPGMRADLVLLEADPLADAMHLFSIAAVVRDGRWLSRAEIDARLEEIAARHR